MVDTRTVLLSDKDDLLLCLLVRQSDEGLMSGNRLAGGFVLEYKLCIDSLVMVCLQRYFVRILNPTCTSLFDLHFYTRIVFIAEMLADC